MTRSVASTPMHRLAALVELMRPQQWIKNGFVFAGALFGAKQGSMELVGAAVLTSIAFCMASSSAYVLNDYLDREADRLHPTKRNRPLASGAVAPHAALLLMGLCLITCLSLAYIAGPRVPWVIVMYLLINVAYSLRLKHHVVVDVFCIASGFMLRIFAGTWAIGISPSGWMLLTGMFITLFLGFGKRRAEWINAGRNTNRRKVLAAYSSNLLDTFLAITATGTVICYGLYTLDPATVTLHGTNKLIYTVPFVLFCLFRYLFVLHSGGKGENPGSDVLSDRQILLGAAAFVAVTVWLLSR